MRSEQARARRQAAGLIGLTPELIDRLNGLSSAALATLSADMMRTIDGGAFEPVEFPVRKATNPGRRTDRLAARARTAAAKTYQVRARSVRTSCAESHKALGRNHTSFRQCQLHLELRRHESCYAWVTVRPSFPLDADGMKR